MARQEYPYKVQRYPEGEMLWVGECRSGRKAMEFADVIEAADDPPYSTATIEALDSTKEHQATH